MILYSLKLTFKVCKSWYNQDKMLNWIRIKNLALIEATDVEFTPGFNVLTGETGAGKSVLLNTISLLLGARADKGLIRTGTDRCEISAEIKLETPPDVLRQLLEEAGIPLDEQDFIIQVRRIITRHQTRNFINDTPVTLSTLSAIGDFLIDIHAANEHQSLISQSKQLEILDRYSNLDAMLEECAALHQAINELVARREKMFQAMPSKVEAEHLRMIIEEIERISPEPDEDRELSERHAMAANAKNIMETASSTVYMLNESENSVADQLATVYRNLQELERIVPDKAGELAASCDRINDQLRELAYDIEEFSSRIELDEEEFTKLEERLSAIQRLKRRYGPGLENVFDTLNDAQERLKVFEDAAKLRDELDREEAELLAKLKEKAGILSKSRKENAIRLTSQVIKKLNRLGFLECSLKINFEQIQPGPRGMDRIDLMFSANPGEALQPLRNIASSGEISRVMLALKTVLADADSIPVLIFDEIDVNIGGRTAITVGEELKQLSKSHQLLCISHLPQVASQADTHFLVSKSSSDGRTMSHISRLNDESKRDEIVRMLGGGNAALAHADELLSKH